MKHISTNISFRLRSITCFITLILSVNVFSQQLATDPVAKEPRQLATTASNRAVSVRHNSSIYQNKSINISAYQAAPISVGTLRSHRRMQQSPSAVSSANSLGYSGSSTTKQSTSSSGSSSLQGRGLIFQRNIDDFKYYEPDKKEGKNPPYNPPEVSDENFDEIPWQKATNGSPVGDGVVQLLLLAMVFCLIRRRSLRQR